MSNENAVAVINWQEQLRPDEIGKDDNNTQFVYLKGLRRLAKLKGIKSESHPMINAIVLKKKDGTEYPLVQVSYTVEFADGTVYSDVADAHTYNVDGVFSAYPTAIAASRAEARALRKSLDIALVSKEELGANPEVIASLKNEITPVQKKVISTLMKSRGINNQMDIIKNATPRTDVYDISTLSYEEAQNAIKYLNNLKANN